MQLEDASWYPSLLDSRFVGDMIKEEGLSQCLQKSYRIVAIIAGIAKPDWRYTGSAVDLVHYRNLPGFLFACLFRVGLVHADCIYP